MNKKDRIHTPHASHQATEIRNTIRNKLNLYLVGRGQSLIKRQWRIAFSKKYFGFILNKLIKSK